eukprot:symbB.v1.2.018695.t1/scaffold1410.1/size216244/21
MDQSVKVMSADQETVDLDGLSVRLAIAPESARVGCEDVTGFQAWMPATRAAARAFRKLQLSESRLVLELGCGLGALGTAMSREQGSFIVMTDKELPVLKLAQQTATTNAGAKLDVVAYDFVRGSSPWRQGCFDSVLAADVLFLDQLSNPLFEAFRVAGGSTSVLGHQIRRAVYRGEDGQPCLEVHDSALERFRQLAKPHLRSTEEFPEEESAALTLEWPSSCKRPRLG